MFVKDQYARQIFEGLAKKAKPGSDEESMYSGLAQLSRDVEDIHTMLAKIGKELERA